MSAYLIMSLSRVKNFDLFPRISSDHQTKSVLGGVLSVVSLTVMTSLFLYETICYLSSPYAPNLKVEGYSQTSRMRIDLNISFTHMPCEVITAHYSDATGSHFIASELKRIRISKKGKYLWDRETQKVLLLGFKETSKASCGSCYGAETFEGQCCNTCEEVIEAYQRRGWQLPRKNLIEQCRRKLQDTIEGPSEPEGCLLFGYINVKKNPGNFHFSISQVGQMMLATGALNIDGSHKIHNLQFNDPKSEAYSGISPFEDYFVEGKYVSQYYLKVAPAILPSGERTYHTSAHFHSLDQILPPEIIFNYDVEPIVTVYRPYETLSEFLVNLCAIIGGWYAVSLFLIQVITK